MKHIPSSTYRVQLNSRFNFESLKNIVPYLSELGISDIYASPFFKARSGSMHGYDVVDPRQLNPELGTPEIFEELINTVHSFQLGWLQDIVPNHMAFDSQNEILMDVLEKGPDSHYADFFDIDWESHSHSLQGKILTPFLGSFYGDCLENGELVLAFDEHGFSINYYEHRYPLCLDSYIKILTHNSTKLKQALGEEHPDYVKFLGVLYVLKSFLARELTDDVDDQTLFIKRLLWELYNQNDFIKDFIDQNVRTFNGTKGQPESFDQLDNLLYEQHYRLSFWKVGTEEINYRRFFYVNDLISLKIEKNDVFEHVHALISKLLAENKINGLRIDHVDGLYDPTSYLARLGHYENAYLVVEKILDFAEDMPENWSIHGTTGYDFLNVVNGLFCQKENEYAFDKIYQKFARNKIYLTPLVYEKQKLIIEKHMAGDIDNLAHVLIKVSSRYRYGNDFTLYGLSRALIEVLAMFPIYRTYISAGVLSKTDINYINNAVRRAKTILPDFENELDFIARVLVLDFDENMTTKEQQQWLHFVMRFQQMTGPLMAKGFEDTVLYQYNRFLSLNEVGGNPGKFGVSDIEFHHFNKNRQNRLPHTMNATATHDTKRGEDVRARLNVLSELPAEWQQHVNLWSRMNRRLKTKVNDIQAPDFNDEYFLYQTLIGSFPFYETEFDNYLERIKSYVIKAVREAKVHTAWLKPDSAYEDAYITFVNKILTGYRRNKFLLDFKPFQQKIAYYGMFNSLSQTLLKITSPGLPDFYQGTEGWDLNLVDPDNRRPVDYEKRYEQLRLLQEKFAAEPLALMHEVLRDYKDGRIKLLLMHRALKMKSQYSTLFTHGEYVPLEIDGTLKNHVIAFARHEGELWSVTIVPRFLTKLISEHEYPLGEKTWTDTFIKPVEGMPSRWQHAITGQSIICDGNLRISETLRHFPVALLIGS